MKSVLLCAALIVNLLILPTKADESQTLGTWQVATAVASRPAVWQLNTATGEMRMCQLVVESVIGCTGWIRASEQQINLKQN
jgi:hypothetical protein